MSVNLLEKQKISKIANTLAGNKDVCKFVETLPFFKERRKWLFEYKENTKDFIERAIWYAYIGNVTAFNCQYGKGVSIDLKLSSEDKFDSLQEGIRSLGNLIYNCYTNDGNYFVGKEWLESLQSIRDKFAVQGWDSK
jgi:hypothetical protein